MSSSLIGKIVYAITDANLGAAARGLVTSEVTAENKIWLSGKYFGRIALAHSAVAVPESLWTREEREYHDSYHCKNCGHFLVSIDLPCQNCEIAAQCR